MTTARRQIRARRPDDINVLAAALLRQQGESGYPVRNPLPMPVEDFLHADDAVAAWTAELDGRPAGHVCRTGPARSFTDADVLNAVCARAYGCAVADLTWINAFFVDTDARGLGLGRQLLHTVVDDALQHGLRPCLEVHPAHPAALSLYVSSGWTVVHRLRPDWLRAAVGDQGPSVHVMTYDLDRYDVNDVLQADEVRTVSGEDRQVVGQSSRRDQEVG